jgi:hypothetical protein
MPVAFFTARQGGRRRGRGCRRYLARTGAGAPVKQFEGIERLPRAPRPAADRTHCCRRTPAEGAAPHRGGTAHAVGSGAQAGERREQDIGPFRTATLPTIRGEDCKPAQRLVRPNPAGRRVPTSRGPDTQGGRERFDGPASATLRNFTAPEHWVTGCRRPGARLCRRQR